MVRRITLVKRSATVTEEEFLRHWREQHAPIVCQAVGLRGYRQTRFLDAPDDLGWSGMGEMWFDSLAQANAAFATEPLGSELLSDSRRFLERWCPMLVEEYVVRGGADPAAPAGR